MARGRARSHLRPIRTFSSDPEQAEERGCSYSPDRDDDDDSLKLFPPRANSPLLSSPSNPRSHRPLSPSHWSNRLRSRAFVPKLSVRWLRVTALVLLSLSAIGLFLLFPWHHRPNLDLSQLRDLEDPHDAFAVHNLSAPDGSIYASFIGLGASVQSLLVKDRQGSFRDIVLGYDNTTEYLTNPANPRLGSIVGRFANRIKNSSFSIPSYPKREFRITPNEHGGMNTLHGGNPGWDRRPFKVEVKNLSYISFSLLDRDGEQGFPHTVSSKIEYELQPGAKWKIRLSATAEGQTPIMLSSHVYWNLDAYSANRSASEHYLQVKADHHIAVDGILIPTGKIVSVKNTAVDFRKPTQIGARLNQTHGLCGSDCTGYDNALVYDEHRPLSEPVMHLWSAESGINMSVITDQPSLQMYTCNGIVSSNATIKPIPRKASQGGPNAFYENHSCVVIEQQNYIDAINNPQWKINSIYGPKRPYEWNALYQFSVI